MLNKTSFSFILLLSFLGLYSSGLYAQLYSEGKKIENNSGSGTVNKGSDYQFKITETKNNSYCYDIFKGDKLLIHQTSIPGIPGNEGFRSKTDAEKIARLVIGKLERGEMPPSVSKEELQKLKVLQTNK